MPRKKMSRSEFIRQNINLPADQIIAAGKKKGMEINKPLISYVRHYDKKNAAKQVQRKRGLKTRRKVVPTSALETHIHEHQKALGLSPEFEELKGAIGDFMVGVMTGIRQMVQAEIREYFKKLGG